MKWDIKKSDWWHLCLDALTGNYEDDFEDIAMSESFAKEETSDSSDSCGEDEDEDDEAQVCDQLGHIRSAHVICSRY